MDTSQLRRLDKAAWKKWYRQYRYNRGELLRTTNDLIVFGTGYYEEVNGWIKYIPVEDVIILPDSKSPPPGL